MMKDIDVNASSKLQSLYSWCEEDIKQYDDADEIEIKKMYYQDMSEDITIYIVQTTLLNKHKYIDKEVILAKKLDKKNGAFAIIPKNAYDKINLGENIKYSDSSIEKNIAE